MRRRRRRSSAVSGVPGDRSGTRTTEPPSDRLEREVVAARPLADDRFERDVVEEVDLAERLAPRRVGEVDLDERPLDREERVAQRDARMGQAAGVDDRDVEVAPWSRSMSAPSWFDWKKAIARPSSAARAAIPAWISSSDSYP